MFDAVDQVHQLSAAENSLLAAQFAVVQIITIIVTPCTNTDPRNQSMEDKIQLKATLRNLARSAIPFSGMACMLHDIIDDTDLMHDWSNRNMTSQWKQLAEEALRTITIQYQHVLRILHHVLRHVLGCRAHLSHIIITGDSDSDSD